MGMNVGDWYSDPAQRYNDVIFPQKDRAQPKKDWRQYDRKTSKAEKTDDTPTKELSAAAKKLLDKLKKTYDNVDFSVAGSNNSADARAKLAAGTRKYSVLFTNDELEKMATDEEYQKSMLNKMHEGFQTVATESAKLGFQAADPAKGNVKSVGIIFGSDGSSSIYKEMTDSMEEQRTRIEEQREKRSAQKKVNHDKPPVRRNSAYEKRMGGGKEYGRRGMHR